MARVHWQLTVVVRGILPTHLSLDTITIQYIVFMVSVPVMTQEAERPCGTDYYVSINAQRLTWMPQC